MGRQQAAQRPDYVVPLEHPGQQQYGRRVGQIGVVDVPVLAVLAADMAQREVGRELAEALGRSFGHHHRIARAKRGVKPGGVIIAWIEPFGTNRRDIGQQGAGITDRPQWGRGGRHFDRDDRG